jgi:Carboxypeptidase regulatory-like domain
MSRDGSRLGQFGSALGLLLCLTTAVATLQNPLPKPPATGSGAVSGVVSDAVNGRPLAGVVVTLIGGGSARRGTVTDSKGRFVFTELPAAERYYLDADKSGYAADGLARPGLLFAPETSFALKDGEWIADANFAMQPLGAIGGTVVDEVGEPVVNVPVHVLVRIPIAATMRLAAGPAARTDDRGTYRVPGLLAGSYLVAVQSVQSVLPPSTPAADAAGLSQLMITLGRRSVPATPALDVGGSLLVIGQYPTPPPAAEQLRVYPPVFFPNARSLAAATPIDLAAGEEKRNIDLSLQPVSGSTISGRVNAPPNVVAGLVVRLLPDGAETLTRGFEQATALVRADGTFTMVGVPPGRYTLEARSTVSYVSFRSGTVQIPAVLTTTPGMVAAENSATFSQVDSTVPASFGTQYFNGPTGYSGRLAVTVGSADLDNLVVDMARGVSISGRVVRDDGAPLPNVQYVGAVPANGDPVLAGAPSDRTVGKKPDGAFIIDGLQRGQYFLSTLGVIKSIIADGGDYTDRPFDTTAGSDISGVVVTLASKPVELSGVVRDRQGSVVRAGAVILFPVDRELWTRYGVTPLRIRTATFFAAGGYQLPRLMAGEYFAIAVEPSQARAWIDPRFFAAAAPQATKVTLEWGVPAVQDLTLRRVEIK